MDQRALSVLAASYAIALAPASAAEEPPRLDLRLDPAEVETWHQELPPHDQVVPAPAASPLAVEPDPEPGWRLKPRLDLDIMRDGGSEGGRSFKLDDVELESLGLRLQRTW